jgi:hypothetical protein
MRDDCTHDDLVMRCNGEYVCRQCWEPFHGPTADQGPILIERRYPNECNEYEYIDKPALCVTVYEISRHYGGPEEGGWWYDWYTPVCSVPLIDPGSRTEALEIKRFLRPRFTDRDHTMHYEYEAGEHATRQRPRYE